MFFSLKCELPWVADHCNPCPTYQELEWVRSNHGRAPASRKIAGKSQACLGLDSSNINGIAGESCVSQRPGAPPPGLHEGGVLHGCTPADPVPLVSLHRCLLEHRDTALGWLSSAVTKSP